MIQVMKSDSSSAEPGANAEAAAPQAENEVRATMNDARWAFVTWGKEKHKKPHAVTTRSHVTRFFC